MEEWKWQCEVCMTWSSSLLFSVAFLCSSCRSSSAATSLFSSSSQAGWFRRTHSLPRCSLWGERVDNLFKYYTYCRIKQHSIPLVIPLTFFSSLCCQVRSNCWRTSVKLRLRSSKCWSLSFVRSASGISQTISSMVFSCLQNSKHGIKARMNL